MLENEDNGDSDAWSVTDRNSCRSDVDEEDDCDVNMVPLPGRKFFFWIPFPYPTFYLDIITH